MPTTTERNRRILEERAHGATLQELAERHGISHQLVHRITREHIDEMELRLLRNRATGDVELFVVPFQSQENWQLANDYFTWVLHELHQREIDLKVDTRYMLNGTMTFAVEDITDYSKRSNG